MNMEMIVVIVVLFDDPLGACDDDGGDDGGGGDLSCEGYCGSSAPGGCYCDDQCEYFGDCCSDYL